MDHGTRKTRTLLLAASALVLPILLAACGGGGSAASSSSGGKKAGATPTSALAAVISRVRSAYQPLRSLGQAAALPSWVTMGTGGKSVALLITTSGSAFNGAARGALTITVPQGWRVSVTDRNTTSAAQSIVVTAKDTMPLPSTGFTPAMAGAETAHPATGQASGSTQRFSFTASPAGTYLMVDAVPGRAAAGIWAHFDVSATAKAPAVQIA